MKNGKGKSNCVEGSNSYKGYYVGWLYQEDEVTEMLVRLTDYLNSKKEALEWIEAPLKRK